MPLLQQLPRPVTPLGTGDLTGIVRSQSSANRRATYVSLDVQRTTSGRIGALSIRVPRARTLAVCLAFAAIGFTPIGALALTIGGLWSLTMGALVLIVPAVLTAVVLGFRNPRYGRYALEGLAAGLAAVLIYDVVRWTFVAFGLWGDFIPNIGGWLNGTGQPDWILGYAFRWLGDGGGMGLTFMVAARTFVPRMARPAALGIGIAYGLSIWLCLLVTLIVSPEGQTMLFPLTAVTLLLSWIGHVVYGAVLGAFLSRGTRLTRMPQLSGLS
jgi:hypothetical protein